MNSLSLFLPLCNAAELCEVLQIHDNIYPHWRKNLSSAFFPFPLCSHYVISLVDDWLPSWLIGWLAALQSDCDCVTDWLADAQSEWLTNCTISWFFCWLTAKVTDRLVCWLTLISCFHSWFIHRHGVILHLSYCQCASWKKNNNNSILVCLSKLYNFPSCLWLPAPYPLVPTEHIILLKIGHKYIYWGCQVIKIMNHD